MRAEDATQELSVVEKPIGVSSSRKRGSDSRPSIGVEGNLRGNDLHPLIRDLLVRLGEDPEREGLQRTPERVERSLRYLTQGYFEDIEKLFARARFVEQYDEMVLVKDIDFFSLCEHHLIPFFGKCHVAYIPDGKILGLSKIPRVVDILSRRLQVQERLTCQIADALKTHLNPKGVAVVMEAQHLCTMMRGVQKQNTRMVTSSMLGTFRSDPKTRMEFLSLLKGGHNT